MINKLMSKKHIYLFFIMLLTVVFSGCASKDRPEDKDIILEAEPVELFFSDWQYSGFGSEYPQWAEAFLLGQAQNESSQEQELIVITADGKNVDICKILADEKSAGFPAENLINETWVIINPEYEGFENPYTNPYVYIKIYKKTFTMEEY